MTYQDFLRQKTRQAGDAGFKPLFLPESLFDFQRLLVEWAVRKGRSAIFADCGLGKTLMQLVWAENVVRKTNDNVLILTPLAVGRQTQHEAERFGIEAHVSRDGTVKPNITVTNYERLHHFDPSQFQGVVCDESSILKAFGGSTRMAVTDFMSRVPYRLLCTATPAPNDYMELGTSSQALGVMEYKHMLAQFFTHDGGETSKWRLKGHAKGSAFWQWMCSWARAVRTPSDLGFSDKGFSLPKLHIQTHIIDATRPREGMLFAMPAVGLQEQREERKMTLNERCQRAADLINDTKKTAVAWCHLNAEGDMLAQMIDGAVQVSGSDKDERKEEIFEAFSGGDIRVIVTKPTIAGFGLNWQHCSHQTFFPSHSYEQQYQAIRRSWRFGQQSDVTIDMIATEGEMLVIENLKRKADDAEQMMKSMVGFMNHELKQQTKVTAQTQEKIPSWLS